MAKTLNNEQVLSGMAGSGLPGGAPARAPSNPLPPVDRSGKPRSGRVMDPSEWEQSGQAEFSRALGAPAPRQAAGGPGPGKNSGANEFGGKGKKVI